MSHTSGPKPVTVLVFHLSCVVLGSCSEDWVEYPGGSCFCFQLFGRYEGSWWPSSRIRYKLNQVACWADYPSISLPGKQNEFTVHCSSFTMQWGRRTSLGLVAGRSLGPNLLKIWVWAAFSLWTLGIEDQRFPCLSQSPSAPYPDSNALFFESLRSAGVHGDSSEDGINWWAFLSFWSSLKHMSVLVGHYSVLWAFMCDVRLLIWCHYPFQLVLPITILREPFLMFRTQAGCFGLNSPSFPTSSV